MSYHRSIGALTAAQVQATDHTLTRLWQHLGEQTTIVADARAAGFDQGVLEGLTNKGNALMARIEQLSIQVDGLSSAQYDEWRQRLDAFGTEVDLYTGEVRTHLGTGASVRNWKIATSTAGALAVAAAIGAAIWYYRRQA